VRKLRLMLVSATEEKLGTASLLAAIVLVTALGSFGAVRAWFPKAQPIPAVPVAAASVNVPHAIDRASAAGRLSIVTDPADAQVEVDGRPRGKSPVVIDGLATGAHRISVVSDSGVATRTVTVSNGVVSEVVFSLPRPAAPAASVAPVAGWVAIASPFPVEMVEHDEIVGTSDAAKIMLAAGTHQLLLRNDTFGFEVKRTIVVAPGQVTSVQLDPPKALLNVNARPWADVLVDGETVGQTPLSGVSLTVGPHEITFRHPQLGERTEQVVVTMRGPNRATADFTK
jgi:hypothetical protein